MAFWYAFFVDGSKSSHHRSIIFFASEPRPKKQQPCKFQADRIHINASPSYRIKHCILWMLVRCFFYFSPLQSSKSLFMPSSSLLHSILAYIGKCSSIDYIFRTLLAHSIILHIIFECTKHVDR